MIKKKKAPKTLFGARVSSLILVCVCASFLGWLTENIFCMLSGGVFDDRHQLLPFIIAYGVGVFLLFLIFGIPTKARFFKWRILGEGGVIRTVFRVAIYYVSLFVLIMLLEAATGLFFEHCLGIKNWNYSNIPLHVTQYTSVPTTFGFATGITLLMQFVFPAALRLFDKIPKKTAACLAAVFSVLIVLDFLLMFFFGVFTGAFPNYWSFRI